jgi:hypothetical protein
MFISLNAGLDAIFNENSMEVEGNVKQINHLLELQNFLYIKKIAVSF